MARGLAGVYTGPEGKRDMSVQMKPGSLEEEELTRRYRVDSDSLGNELQSERASERSDGSLGGRVVKHAS